MVNKLFWQIETKNVFNLDEIDIVRIDDKDYDGALFRKTIKKLMEASKWEQRKE